MNFSDLEENAEHVFLKTEFDLDVIMLLLEHKNDFSFKCHSTEMTLVSMFIMSASLE